MLENDAVSHMYQGLTCFGFSFKYGRKKKTLGSFQNINAAITHAEHTEITKRWKIMLSNAISKQLH